MNREALTLLRRNLERYEEHKNIRRFLDEASAITDVADAIPAELVAAYDAGNLLWVELLILAGHKHPSPALVPVACRILRDRNESLNNEDVVELLEKLRSEEAVPCLAETLAWEPEWDEYRNLGVKSIWALGAIGSEDARRIVAAALRSNAPKIREAAEAVLGSVGPHKTA